MRFYTFSKHQNSIFIRGPEEEFLPRNLSIQPKQILVTCTRLHETSTEENFMGNSFSYSEDKFILETLNKTITPFYLCFKTRLPQSYIILGLSSEIFLLNHQNLLLIYRLLSRT